MESKQTVLPPNSSNEEIEKALGQSIFESLQLARLVCPIHNTPPGDIKVSRENPRIDFHTNQTSQLQIQVQSCCEYQGAMVNQALSHLGNININFGAPEVPPATLKFPEPNKN